MDISVSVPLMLGCLWALLATGTALLPMRWQAWPGVPLLIAAPLLLAWIGHDHGIWWVLIGLTAVLSMFRNPLIYLVRRVLGLPVTLPPGLKPEDLSPRLRRLLPKEARAARAEEAEP